MKRAAQSLPSYQNFTHQKSFASRNHHHLAPPSLPLPLVLSIFIVLLILAPVRLAGHLAKRPTSVELASFLSGLDTTSLKLGAERDGVVPSKALAHVEHATSTLAVASLELLTTGR